MLGLEPPALSLLVIDRSARLSVSVAEMAVPTGGVTVAVFDNVPVAVELTVPVTLYVTALPAGSETLVSSILPEPLGVKPVAVALPVLAGGPSVAGDVGRDRIGDRDPGGVARACVADDDGVDQRLSGG